ncbi:MAG: hypothetical protein E7043_06510 [Lentisphaerae bacterium]|nr:hypothetical protein [Lentisphaerota bacterium]
MYYGKFQSTVPGSGMPAGFLKKWLDIQNNGLSSHYKEQGYPFNTLMWDGGVGAIVPASIVYNDEAAETPSQDVWWPYEQTAYLLDGLVRLGILTNDKEKIALFEKNLRFVIDHPGSDGLLGHAYGASDSEWPMAVFFRAAMAYCEYSGAERAKAAFIRHYQALPQEKLALGFRHINNLEGVLKAYEWSNEQSLLDKAVAAYRQHDEYYSLHTEDEFELYRSKINSGRNYVIHGVSFSESIKLPILLYLYTGDKSYLLDAEKGLAEALERHEQIPGLPSSNEDFAGRDPLQGYETCVINDFAWSLGYFLMASGDGKYADRMEKIFYNAFPGSLLKDFSALQYLSSPNQVIADSASNNSFFYRGCATFRQFRSDHSAQCCTGNVHRILPNYIMRMWMLNKDNAPAAVLYGPSEYSGCFNGCKYSISEETNYPCEESIAFRFTLTENVTMPFSFRIPAWCKNPSVMLNGKILVMPEVINGFAVIERKWQNGDTLTLSLPMTPVQKFDRYWSHFEYGTLVFSLPVSYQITRENPSPFAPCAVTPQSAWDYAVASGTSAEVICNPDGDLFSDVPPLKMKIKGVKVSNFDELEDGRYTPEVPLFHRCKSEEIELELVPYGNALLRITAFPDTVKRKSVNCYQVLASRPYPYDFASPMDKQRFLPEKVDPATLLPSAKTVVPERSGYCDLLKQYPQAENSLAYLYFRFYSDCERDAYFALSVSSGGEFFFENQKICVIEPVSDAEYIAPEIVPVRLKKGYNILVAKCVLGQIPMQYRRVWGAMAKAFYSEK